MTKCDIWCMAKQHKNHSGDPVEYFEIGIDGRVWPCCHYVSTWFKASAADEYEEQLPYKKLFDSDKVLSELMKSNPEWNNTLYTNLDDIINNPIFSDYIGETGWNSENPPALCVHFCDRNKT